MANIQFDNKSFFAKKYIGKTQTAQSVRVSVRNDITEVLSVGVEHFVGGYDIVGGEVNFYGKTTIKLLYRDGQTVQSANFGADFTSALPCDAAIGGNSVVFRTTTQDVATETNANTATINILIEVEAWAYAAETVDFATGGDVFVKTETVEVMTDAKVTDIPFVVDNEFASTRNIGTVLLADSQLVVRDYGIAEGVLTVSGDGVGRLTYMSGNDMITDVFPFDWTRELDATNLADVQLQLTPVVRGTKVRLDISDDGDNTAFSLETQATLCVQATTIGGVTVVSDLYSTDCNFTLGRSSVETTLPCGGTVCAVSESFGVDSGVVTAVNVGATVTKCTGGERKATVEGYVTATLIYRDGDVYRGETKELPFVKQVDVDYLSAECACNARVIVGEVAVEHGDTLRVQMWMDIFAARNVSVGLITSAEETPFDKSAQSAIEVCIAKKGDTLWNLAKNLHLSEEELVATNPLLTNPLEEDTRVVVFNRI